MKKQLIAALVLVAAAIGAAAPSWAFQSVQKTTVTAGTFVGGSKIARFTLNVRSVNNQLVNLPVTSSITWTNASSGQGWLMADRLLVINSTVTDLNGGIQIYTENTASDAQPKFLLPDPGHPTNKVNSASGLLQGTSGETSSTLPMAWTIKSSTKIIEGGTAATGVGAADPNNGLTTGINNRFQWLFVSDRINTSGLDFNEDGIIDPTAGDAAPFVDGNKYLAMVRQGGIHTTQTADPDPAGLSPQSASGDAFVYFQANFAQAPAQTAYQTTTLRIEAYIQ